MRNACALCGSLWLSVLFYYYTELHGGYTESHRGFFTCKFIAQSYTEVTQREKKLQMILKLHTFASPRYKPYGK
jgi:hypothetical protein